MTEGPVADGRETREYVASCGGGRRYRKLDRRYRSLLVGQPVSPLPGRGAFPRVSRRHTEQNHARCRRGKSHAGRQRAAAVPYCALIEVYNLGTWTDLGECSVSARAESRLALEEQTSEILMDDTVIPPTHLEAVREGIP
jgi:hypothetical protein